MRYNDLEFAYRCDDSILAQRLACLLGCMYQMPNTVIENVKACIELHNLIWIRKLNFAPRVLDCEDANYDVIPGMWKNKRQLFDMEQRLTGYQESKQCKLQRLTLTRYLLSAQGSVLWQHRMVTC